MNPRLGPILDMILDPASSAGERENARTIARKYLAEENTTVTELLNAPRFSQIKMSYGQMVAQFNKLRRERDELAKKNDNLQKRMIALVANQGGDDIDKWLMGDPREPLPPARKNHYPFAVLKAVCVQRIGEDGWQAAMAVAMQTVPNGVFDCVKDGRFRFGQIQDWQRSRRGVPVNIVQFLRETPYLEKPKPHIWTTDQRAEVEAKIADGEADSEIALLMVETHGIIVTSEAIRSIRKAVERRKRQMAIYAVEESEAA